MEITRVSEILTRSTGNKFIERLLTEREMGLLEHRAGSALAKPIEGRLAAEFIAGRFAAKEAVAKALGCGIGGVLGFHDIEILPDAKGRPECRLSTSARHKCEMDDSSSIHVSISHAEAYAVAFAVWEG